jgi:glycerophosphoryl diester phosphodiesterase
MFGEFQIIGHRGWTGKYPENTLLGFSKAIDVGATMIEFDVQITKDNHLAVFHDETTKRLCDKNINISSSTRKEIKELSVDGQEIPFLDDIFYDLQDNIKYYIELKTFPKTTTDQRTKLAFYAVNEIMKHRLNQNCVIVGFDPNLLHLCKRLGFNNLGQNLNHEEKPYFCKLACRNHTSIKAPVTEPTFAWTVNNARRMKTLLNNNVSGIVTDHVDRLVEVYKKHGKLTTV